MNKEQKSPVAAWHRMEQRIWIRWTFSKVQEEENEFDTRDRGSAGKY